MSADVSCHNCPDDCDVNEIIMWMTYCWWPGWHPWQWHFTLCCHPPPGHQMTSPSSPPTSQCCVWSHRLNHHFLSCHRQENETWRSEETGRVNWEKVFQNILTPPIFFQCWPQLLISNVTIVSMTSVTWCSHLGMWWYGSKIGTFLCQIKMSWYLYLNQLLALLHFNNYIIFNSYSSQFNFFQSHLVWSNSWRM